jgi:hypothetical protein
MAVEPPQPPALSWHARLRSALLGLYDDAFAWRYYSPAFFRDGWGDPLPYSFASRPSGELPRLEWAAPEEADGVRFTAGSFLSPLHEHLPPEAKLARVQLVEPLPKAEAARGPRRALVWFAAGGDEGFGFRRRSYAAPLAREHGVTTVLLQLPYYGQRRPAGQPRCFMRTVGELQRHMVAQVEEGRALLHWLHASGRFDTLGVAGVSKGGCVAAMTAALCPDLPLAAASFMSVDSAEAAYLDGLVFKCVSVDKVGGRDALRAHLRGEFMFRPDTADAAATEAHLRALPDYAGRAPQPLAFVAIGAAHDKFASVDSCTNLYRNVTRYARCVAGELRWVAGGHMWGFLSQPREFVAGALRALELIEAHGGTRK